MTADRPKLRKLERHRLWRGGEDLLVLRDPLGVAEPVALPAETAAILDLLDGQRTATQLRHSLLLRGGPRFAADEVAALIEELGDGFFLEDDAFRERWAAVLADFLAASTRSAAHADVLYPADPRELRDLLGDFLGEPGERLVVGADVLGVVTPHQPFERAGGLLDATLRGLPSAAELDLVVVLGTDHHPGLVPVVATAKAFETPLGEVRADAALVADLDARLPWLRREEIRHRQAISVEVAAILLRHLYPEPPPILPLLCGQTALFGGDGTPAVEDFLGAMEQVLAGRRVLFWASAELTHAGPAYGQRPLAADAEAALVQRDRWLVDPLLHGQPDALARRLVDEDPALGRPSGAAAIVTFARLLPVGVRGSLAAQVVAPAPGAEAGLAGLVGVRMYRPGAASGA